MGKMKVSSIVLDLGSATKLNIVSSTKANVEIVSLYNHMFTFELDITPEVREKINAFMKDAEGQKGEAAKELLSMLTPMILQAIREWDAVFNNKVFTYAETKQHASPFDFGSEELFLGGFLG